jgi:aryl-alcohol dehydrogenase-like predicted oxidoreductase
VQYALLGRSGVRVSRICIGSALYGVWPEAKEIDTFVGRALELGINFIDTASSYGNRSSADRPGVPPAAERESAEELIGKALKGRREQVVLASKVQERVFPGPNGGGPDGGGLSRLHIIQLAERTLRRLQTDHIDVYYAHHPDPTTPVEETLRAMDDLVRQGKVRYFALSTYPGWQMVDAIMAAERMNAPVPIAHQVRYSMAQRAPEQEVVPACLRFGVGITAFSPLASGLLAGGESAKHPNFGSLRYRTGADSVFNAQELAVAAKLDTLGAEWGYSPAQLALAWLLSRPAVVSAIVGAGELGELKENAQASDVELSPEQLEILEPIGTNLPDRAATPRRT